MIIHMPLTPPTSKSESRRDGFRQGRIGGVGIDAVTENGGDGTVGDFEVGHQKIVAGKVYGIQKDGRILGNTDFRDVPKVK